MDARQFGAGCVQRLSEFGAGDPPVTDRLDEHVGGERPLLGGVASQLTQGGISRPSCSVVVGGWRSAWANSSRYDACGTAASGIVGQYCGVAPATVLANVFDTGAATD